MALLTALKGDVYEPNKLMKFKWFLLTGFYSGLFPKAPGTAGSILATLIAYLIIKFIPTFYMTLWLLIILFTILGLKFTEEYEKNGGIHDDKRIVIDEFVGVWITIGLFNDLETDTEIKLLLSLITFRLFDIYKPSIIGKVDKLKGAISVMGDDILAGIFAAITAGILYIGYLKII